MPSAQPRRRAYEPVYSWAFQRIPLKVEKNGVEVANPARNSAVFVVHGMGQQLYTETAVLLRNGFEDAIDRIKRPPGADDIPTPYIAEGHWADYGEFQQTFPEECIGMNEGELKFFTGLWKKRGRSAPRAAAWFAWQAARLVFDREVRTRTSLWQRFTYCWVTFLAWVGIAVMLIRHSGVLADILGDVRLYEDPRGEVERAMVQRIEWSVGERFLQLLGLDWEFNELQGDKRLKICGDPHQFQYVTWVAHSLGGVISYNVIADLLTRCEEKRAWVVFLKARGSTKEGKELDRNIDRVEKGLHRFITIGSPLQKFAFLFPHVLRPWPEWFQERLRQDSRSWWVNFFHIWDPVSGRLLENDFFPQVKNLHSRLWRLPLWAHLSYWRDVPVLTYIVSRTYGKDILPVTIEDSDFMAPGRVGWYRLCSLLVALPLMAILVVGIVCGTYWAIVHHSEIWDFAWGKIKDWIGLGK